MGRPMNRLLEQAFAEVAQRPDDEQSFIAALVMDELHDEQVWQAKFRRDADRLDAIAAKVQAKMAI